MEYGDLFEGVLGVVLEGPTLPKLITLLDACKVCRLLLCLLFRNGNKDAEDGEVEVSLAGLILLSSL